MLLPFSSDVTSTSTTSDHWLQSVFGAVVPTFFVTEGGVTLSEVSRIQAEHKQQNDGFWTKAHEAVAGVFRQVVTVVGAGGGSQEIESAIITADEIYAYRGVAERNAQTAVLMHAVKLSQRLRKELEDMDLRLHVADALPKVPALPARPASGSVCDTDDFMELQNIDEMIANLKSEVLSRFDFAFWKRANELNSRAAAIGKLLSEQGAFFRKLVSPLPQGKSETIQTGVVLTSWKRAYGEEQAAEFVQLRDHLQQEYNDLQRQLNGCRKQIKDALREYNLVEERRYQAAYGEYQIVAKAYQLETERIRSAAETFRQEALQELAALRVRTE